MNKITSIVLLIILGLVIFAGGMGLGIVYQNKKLKDFKSNISELFNKNIIIATVSGNIVDINGRNITMGYENNSVIIKIRDDAEIVSTIFVKDKNGVIASESKELKFEDLKKRDNIQVNIKILPDGTLEGQSINSAS
jgi:hypothetical protein